MTLTAQTGKEILRFEANGDIYIKGKLVKNDLEVVEGFRELLNLRDVNKNE